MRVLIIMHSSNTVYGAAKSLQKLIENSGWEMDIIYPNSVFHPVNQETIWKYSSMKVNKIYRLFLPFRAKAVILDYKPTLKSIIWESAKRVCEFYDRFKIKQIISSGNYDYVLLNSLALYPLTSISPKTVLYIREYAAEEGKRLNYLVSHVKKANKIIFIDKAITKPFDDYSLDYRVINNPFDMRAVNELVPTHIRQKIEISNDKIIVSLLGKIAAEKGTDFVIDAFNSITRDDVILLIVGSGDQNYVDKCKAITKNTNIRFLGETNNVSEIYAVSDYIIRADYVFATGRTVYEGLYSGCHVILQKESNSEVNDIAHYNEFGEMIHFYTVRDKESLIKVVNSLKKINKDSNPGSSNLDEYIGSVNEYLS